MWHQKWHQKPTDFASVTALALVLWLFLCKWQHPCDEAESLVTGHEIRAASIPRSISIFDVVSGDVNEAIGVVRPRLEPIVEIVGRFEFERLRLHGNVGSGWFENFELLSPAI